MIRLTDSDGEALVQCARNAVSTYLETGATIEPPSNQTEVMKEKAGVFVTIFTIIQSKTDLHELRGCIGYLDARLPLGKATIQAAISAAMSDPRFPPLKRSELQRVLFEVNILDEHVRLKSKDPRSYPNFIKIGVDGLVVSRGGNRGLLLPEVPVEWGWNSEEFLTQCSLKAGLYPDAWLDPETKVYKFKSEIFREIKPLGRIRRVNLISEAPKSSIA